MRQGCPLSCQLFILVAEILAQMIRNEKDIEGICISKTTIKLSQFADDTTCLLKNWNSLIKLYDVSNCFRRMSGLALNENKTLLIWLGPWRTKASNLKNIQQGGDCFNQLGIHVGRSLEQRLKISFDAKLNNMENKFRIWKMRDTSILGRVQLIKSLGISNITYTLSNMEVDSKRIEKAQRLINAFLWQGKPNKVKHSTVIADYDEGGIKMTDLACMNKALRLPWLGRIIDRTNEKWSVVIRHHLEPFGGLSFLLRCNFDVKFCKGLSKFYQEMMQYASLVISEDDSKCIIWNNKEILIQNTSFFWKTWFEKGIIFIQDLLHISGRWMTQQEISNKYNVKSNFLQYLSLMTAMRNIKDQIQTERGLEWKIRPDTSAYDSSVYGTVTRNKLDISTAKCKHYYQILICFEIQAPTAKNRWLETNFSEQSFYNSMPMAKLSISEPKLLSFQYKIINMIWPVEEKLYKWGIKTHDQCLVCGVKDDILHALIECHQTQNWIKSFFDTSPNFQSLLNNTSVEEFIFGSSVPAWNHIIILLKWYVLYCRVKEQNFHTQVYKNNLYLRILSDKNSMNNTQFLLKWGIVDWLIQESTTFGQETGIT